MKKTTRRTFLTLGAMTAGTVAAGKLPRVLASEKALSSQAAIAIAPSIHTFRYDQVQLLEGKMQEQFATNHAFFLAMNEDSLLKPFRQLAGMPAPGEDMGGWYDIDPAFNGKGSFHGFIPGHSFGQYLSGLARASAITGSKPTREKVARLVTAFAPTVTTKFYDNYHLPAYTYDKTSCEIGRAH